MLNGLIGCIGLVVQLTVFFLVYLATSTRRGHALGLLYGAVLAVYGYALVVSVAMFVAVPWQIANILLALLLGLLLLSPRVRSSIATGWAGFTVAARRGWGAICILVVLVAFHAFIAVLKPELSIDGQLYHGPVLATLVQSGSLWGWTPTNEFFYYTDLTMAGGVNLATFTGTARFDDALQITHLVVLVLAINWALSRRFARAWTRVAFAALIVSAPVIWMQPRILYVDLAYGTAVAVAIFVIVFVRRFGRLDILVGATAVAAILATKPAGILTSAILLLVLIAVAVWRRHREGARVGTSIGVAVGLAAIPGAAALVFYLRNMVSFGSPVYPVKVAIGPFEFPGIVDFSVFASGDRGSGLVDPGRILTFLRSIGTGVLHGVEKVDYDPRAGGFGHIPLFVAALVIGILIAQLVLWLRARRRPTAVPLVVPHWKGQLALVGLGLVVLVIQPSPFDTRYVIGPLVVLLVALLLTALVIAAPLVIDACAAALALLLAVGQAAWTEANVYPGLHTIRELRTLDARWQPGTPGNPWGRAASLSWLPQDPGSCSTIAVQTRGGVGPEGMLETSLWGTLPYALYGEQLCNRVIPIVAERDRGGRPVTRHALGAADFALIYTDDLEEWESDLPGEDDCWVEIAEIRAADPYSSDVTVLRNTCS